MFSTIQPIKILNQQIESIIRSAIEILPNLVAALIFLIVIWISRKLILASVHRVLTRAHSRPELISAMTKITSVTVWIIGILIAATIALPSLTPTRLLAGVGFISVALGLAFKDIFENFLAGILILVRKKMRIGDFIECKEVVGQVESINIRESFVRQIDRTLLIVPNSFIYQNPCRILTDDTIRLMTIIASIGNDKDLGETRDKIVATMQSISSVKAEPAIDVSTKEFSSTGTDLTISWWATSHPQDAQRSRDEVLIALRKLEDITACK